MYAIRSYYEIAALVPGQPLLQLQHAAIQQETDEAYGHHGHHDAGQGLAAAVLELIPDELAQPGVLGQHLGGDQHHPAHTEREAHAGEDEGQGGRQDDLADAGGLV